MKKKPENVRENNIYFLCNFKEVTEETWKFHRIPFFIT